MRQSKFTSFILLLVVFVGIFYWVSSAAGTCVNVYVDFGSLDNKTKISKCVVVPDNTNALEVLKAANINIEGTKKYGDKVVCRVNGLPKASKPVKVPGHVNYIESCQKMPADFAYWAVLEKRYQFLKLPFDPANKWGWAQTGISEVYLDRGDSLGLVFSENGKVKFPK